MKIFIIIRTLPLSYFFFRYFWPVFPFPFLFLSSLLRTLSWVPMMTFLEYVFPFSSHFAFYLHICVCLIHRYAEITLVINYLVISIIVNLTCKNTFLCIHFLKVCYWLSTYCLCCTVRIVLYSCTSVFSGVIAV